jgi:hypothetical protein
MGYLLFCVEIDLAAKVLWGQHMEVRILCKHVRIVRLQA